MMCVWEYPEYSLLNCCQILNLEREGISLDEYLKIELHIMDLISVRLLIKSYDSASLPKITWAKEM